MRSPLLLLLILVATTARAANWYEESFFILHEDHHTWVGDPVGRDASLEETARLVGLCKPDVIQIHAKGGPGWTTYPTRVGHRPPELARDVLAIWRDVARRDGYHFSVYYNLGNDAELRTRRPQFARVDPDGNPWRNSLCPNSDVAEAYLWPMIREIMAGYRPKGFWFDGTTHTVRPCYCEACRRRFARETHMSPPKTPDDPAWAAYHRMQRQTFREFVRKTIAEVHKVDPKCLVALNNSYSLRMPETPPEGLGYLTTDIANRVESLSPFAHWYDSLGLPFDLMTEVFTADPSKPGGETHEETIPKPRGQIEQEMAVIVANGGRYSAWDIPTPASGLLPERFALLAEVVGPFLRARQPWCLGRRLPDVSLLHSAAAHYAVNSRLGGSFVSSDNRIDGATAVLAKLHLNYEMIPDGRLAGQNVRSPLLLVEHPEVVTEETASGVLEFLARGGRVLWSGKGLDKRLQKAFGVKVVAEPKGPETLRFEGLGEAIELRRGLYRVECCGAKTRFEVKAADGKSFPLLTSHRVGRGEAFYAAVPLMSRHRKQEVPLTLVEEILDEVLPPVERRVTTDAPGEVEIVLREKGKQQVVHLVNLTAGTRQVTPWRVHRLRKITEIPPARPCRVSLRLASRPVAVHLQPQNVELSDYRYERGRLEVAVPEFPIHQMVVVTTEE